MEALRFAEVAVARPMRVHFCRPHQQQSDDGGEDKGDEQGNHILILGGAPNPTNQGARPAMRRVNRVHLPGPSQVSFQGCRGAETALE